MEKKKQRTLAKTLSLSPKSNKIKREEKKFREEKERVDAANRAKEQEISAKRAVYERTLRNTRKNLRSPEESIRAALKGADIVVPKTSDLFPIVTLCREYHQNNGTYNKLVRREALYRLLVTIRGKTDFLTAYQPERFAKGILGLAACEGEWIRPLEGWKPGTHNAYRQFSSLVRHLTAKYPVPWFMDHAWYGGLEAESRRQQAWFRHIGGGKNIRTAAGLPLHLTKMQAHHFLQAPADFTINQAFRWGVVRDMGGDERTIRAIVPTMIGGSFPEGKEEFWRSVCRWFVDNPMLDTVHYGPIVDYLHNQKYVADTPNRPGQYPLVIPAQANLSMKGRQGDALLRAVADWHHRMGKERGKRGDFTWSPCGIAEFNHEEGKDESRKVFTIREILASKDLREEGNAMKHCVASYANSCSRGSNSIWTMRLTDAYGVTERLVTIEVRDRVITQVRQKFNKYPSAREYSVLSRWAVSANLTISSWVKSGN